MFNGLMRPKDGLESMLFLLIRHFRPRRFFTHRNITSNEKIPVIRASGLARQMTESATVDQTGEYLVQLLLTSNLTRQEARQIAAGWTGDQLSAYLEGENLLTAWITAWKKDESPGLYRAYQNLPAAAPLALRSITWSDRQCELNCPGPLDVAAARDRSCCCLTGRRRSIHATADEVWKSLDAETESTVILFDSARTDSVVSQKQITAALALHPAFPDQLFQVCLNGKLRDLLRAGETPT